MNKIVAAILLVFITNHISAQNLDSLYQKFVNLKNQKSNLNISSLEVEEHTKCGFPTVSAVLDNFDKFSKAQQNVISSLITPTSMQKSIVSPSGFFRIHYDETGNNAVVYDINELAIALDSSYNYEVNILGYTAPPPSPNNLNEDKYYVYVKNLGRNYGVTYPQQDLGNGKMNSYIEIHNSFDGFYTEGIEAAKVTVAHEFHHAIQMGSYIWRSSDTFYYEITATSMEDFVYDEIDDYFDYLRHYFNHPDVTLSQATFGGYELTIWNLFLTQKYPEKGQDIIKRSWELMSRPNNQLAVRAIANAVEEYIDDSFKNVFNEFGVWTFYTNYRSNSEKYFKDASEYPLIKYLVRSNYSPPSKTLMVNSQTVSNNFLLFIDDTQGSLDSIWSIVTNGDVVNGADFPEYTLDFDFTIQSSYVEGASTIIQNKYYTILSSSRENIFSQTNIYNNVIVVDSGIVKKDIDYSYPQPFKLFKHDYVRIPVTTNEFGKADLFIYSSSMDLVYNENVDIKNIEHPFVQWDGKDKNGDNVASGVYIYVTNSEDNIKKGKIVILNE